MMVTPNHDSDVQEEVLVECVSCGRRFAGPGLMGKQCPTCKGELSGIGHARLDERPDENIVEVYRVSDWMQAELLREHLESEGVLVAFRTAMPWGVLTFTVDGLGEVAILALESEAEEARNLIDEYLGKIQTEDAVESEESQEEEDV